MWDNLLHAQNVKLHAARKNVEHSTRAQNMNFQSAPPKLQWLGNVQNRSFDLTPPRLEGIPPGTKPKLPNRTPPTRHLPPNIEGAAGTNHRNRHAFQNNFDWAWPPHPSRPTPSTRACFTWQPLVSLEKATGPDMTSQGAQQKMQRLDASRSCAVDLGES